VRWLPHSRPAGAQDANVLIGTDAETVGARIGELTQLLDARQKAAKQNGNKASFGDPDIVVVWDGSRRLRSMPGVVRLLREGPAMSMYAICLDAEERFLPGECQAVVIAEPRPEEHATAREPVRTAPAAPGGFPSFHAWHATEADESATGTRKALELRLRVEQTGIARVRGVRPDFVSAAWCSRLARALSALRDISGETEDSALPGASRLLDVLQLEPPTGDAISARWRMGGQSTTAVIGESYDGPFGIDMRRDGPHGLIAGTTGSGKSELLQTIVASLAVANTPENMTFVLVDYKGGSAFKDCVKLPHTVGMVTDLDAHLVERALESLGAELKRREHILAAADAKDIEDYQDLVRRDPSHAPVPRLLIVIDEFASMVRDLPDFVTGLVNIAQRGRSLGIHLLLATQRPSGVVSPEIRANTNLRIALRVTTAVSRAMSSTPPRPDTSPRARRAARTSVSDTPRSYRSSRAVSAAGGQVPPIRRRSLPGRGPSAGRISGGPRWSSRRPSSARRRRSPTSRCWSTRCARPTVPSGSRPSTAPGCPHSPRRCCSTRSRCPRSRAVLASCRPPRTASRTCRPTRPAGLSWWTSPPSGICSSVALRAAAARRSCGRSRARWPVPTRRPTSTCTASTAATARSTR
jgi:hypothetical protein